MKEKPRFKVPYCEYCHEYATVKQRPPVDYVFAGDLGNNPFKEWELVCSNHERYYPVYVK